MPGIAVEGMIRGGRLLVTLSGLETAPAEVVFRFEGRPGDDLLERRSWPADFQVARSDAGLLGRIDLGDPWTRAPFSRLVVEDGAGRPYAAGDRWYMHGLYAVTADQFVSRFYRPRDRVYDAEALIFATRQLLRFYDGPQSHRVVAAVILGYKALEVASPALCREAISALDPMITPAFDLPRDTRPRIDGPHLAISIMTVLAHLHLALGDERTLAALLGRAATIADAFADPLTTTSFNMCRLLLLRAFLIEVGGQSPQARAAYMACYEFFRRSLLRLEPNLTRFRELAETHRTVELALRAAESLRGRQPPLTTDEVFTGFARTRSVEATAFLRAGYDAVLAAAAPA